VLGIAEAVDPGDTFVETAVFAAREDESAVAAGAPGFRNAVDSDPALPANREWAVRSSPGSGVDDRRRDRAQRVTEQAELERSCPACGLRRSVGCSTGRRARRGAAAVAAVLESRRAELIEVAAAETAGARRGRRRGRGPSTSRATTRPRPAELDAVPGAAFVPSRVTVVAPPWNFPSIPAGGFSPRSPRVPASCSSRPRRRGARRP
jgi:RHH-type proline utilization regulon transcriptional repressor/proline dehydrogenase/delta 1-pyrroline-5-carboxylate dehydrogenase